VTSLILYVGDRLVDLAPERIATTVYGYDFADPTVRNVNYTSDFSAPFTENNIVTFGYSNELHSNTVKPYRYLSCRYSTNGIEAIKEGILVVQKSENSFGLNIFDNEKELFDLIRDKKLYQLGYLTNGPYKNAQIDAWRLSTSGIISPVIDWGVATSSSVQPDYYLPSWFYYELVTNSLQYTGLELEGDIFLSADLLDLVVPFSLDTWEYPMVFRDQFNFEAVNSVSTVTAVTVKISISTLIYQGSLNVYSVSGWQMDMPNFGATGNYLTVNFKAAIRYTSVGAPGNSFYFRIIVLRGGTEYTVDEQLETMVAPGGGGEFILEGEYNLQDDDDVYVKYFTNSGSPTVTITDVKFTGNTSGRIHDNYVFFNYLLPDMTMGEIVNDFTNRFGIIYRQSAGVLICKTLQEVIANKQNALDWTDKRVKSVDLISFEPEYAKSNAFKYTSSVEDNEDLGTGYLTIDNDTLEEEDTMFQSDFENSENNLILFVNMGRIPVYEEINEAFAWDQVNNAGGFVQLQFDGVDRTEDFPVGSNIKFSSTGGLYLGVYAEVTAISFSVNTLITTNSPYLGAAGSGGTANIVDRAAFGESPGLKLMTLRDRESEEQGITFDTSNRFDYRVAYFEDPAFEKTCGGQYFVDTYYSNLSTALQKYKALTRFYNLSPVDMNNYNNHRIIYDSGDYFLIRKIPNFIAGFVSKVEELLIYPAGNVFTIETSPPITIGLGEGVYTGYEPTIEIETDTNIFPGLGEGLYSGFEPTLYIGPPI
jgi:hypothetical protein